MLLPKGLITVKMQTMQCLTTSTVQAKVFLSFKKKSWKVNVVLKLKLDPC